MFFKNAYIFTLTEPLDLFSFLDKMAEKTFQSCPSTSLASTGWEKPAGYFSDGTLVCRIGHFDLIALKTESKVLPSSAVNKILAAKVFEIETKEERKLRSNERSKLKDEIIHDLLPKALTQEAITFAYVDRVKNRIVIDASTSSKAENVISFLRKTLGSLPVVPLQFNERPSEIITNWLRDKFPEGIVGNKNVSISTDDDGVIRFKNIDLLSNEVKMHVDCGGIVKNVSLIWNETVSFDLSSTLEIKKIKIFDIQQEDLDSPAELFEADLQLFASKLDELLERLITVFSGEYGEQKTQPI